MLYVAIRVVLYNFEVNCTYLWSHTARYAHNLKLLTWLAPLSRCGLVIGKLDVVAHHQVRPFAVWHPTGRTVRDLYVGDVKRL